MTRDKTEIKLVVGVGASAGGLEGFKQLLLALPADTDMTFLLVQHLDPSHKSLLTELLRQHTSMPVMEASHGVEMKANTVYIIRPDTAMATRDGKIELTTPTLHRGVRLPVDHLFRSLAKNYGPQAACVVLSGAGSDGSAGLVDVKAAGGLSIAQNPQSSGQSGMPQSAIDTGAVDLVLDIAEIPRALERFTKLPPRARTMVAVEESSGSLDPGWSLTDKEVGRVAALLEAQLDFDLRVYKPATVERRILRRMMLSGFEQLGEYLERLRTEPLEQQTLVRDLLISVTEFFRDPHVFRALRDLIIDPLVRQTAAGGTLRAWVPGCATGEEPYSIAMEFLDSINASKKRLGLQVFATDIDQDALALARTGQYPPSIAEHMTKGRLESYFSLLEGRGYQVRPALRDVVSFAPHDLTKDPPFSRMNLVSCRNVLIYLTAEAQKHVLKVLHFALQKEGHLLLSTSESTGPQGDLFSTISKTHHIYKKVGASAPISIPRSRTRAAMQADGLASDRNEPAGPRRRRSSDLAQRAVLQAWAPPTIVVAADGAVHFMHGELGPYLQFPQGDDPKLELNAILRPEIATRTRGALYKCRRDSETVVADSSPDFPAGRARITASPARALGDDVVMLSFERIDSKEQPRTPPELPGQAAVIDQLEKELQATREDLRNTVEELETSNEELRSANEESMSMNEELQSANEELEATTEELRSLNEELTTVNAQLREKVEQVEQANDDLNNFFSSTKVATVFLDEGLRVKRFTPAARDLLHIDHADVDRYVRDIARELLQNDLEADARSVLDDLAPVTREILTKDGRWITRSALPYRTENRRIDGVVVTFTDVTDLRLANIELKNRSRRLEMAWEAARGGVFEHMVPLDDTTYHSEQWARVLGYRRNELPAHDHFMSWWHDQVHPEDREGVREAYDDFIAGRTPTYEVELRMRHRLGHWVWVRATSKALERDDKGNVRHVLGMMLDITDLKRIQHDLRESDSRFRDLADSLPLLIWVTDARGRQEYVNTTCCEYIGRSRDDLLGDSWRALIHPDDRDYLSAFEAAVVETRDFHGEARVMRADGAWRHVETWARPRMDRDGVLQRYVGATVDVTERKEAETAHREEKERFQLLADHIDQLTWMADGSGHRFWFNKRWYEYTGTEPEQVEGWGWICAHHPDHVERVEEKLRQCFQTGEVWEDTFPLQRADGAYRWFLARALPIRNADGTVVKWFGTDTDITEQREVERKLVEADRQKDVFLAMLGHELRNPLAAVSSATQFLSQATEQHPDLERTRLVLVRQTAQMARLVEGLLDASRVMFGKIELQRDKVDLSATCSETVSDCLQRSPEREPDLDVSLTPDVWIQGDRVRLRQILDNLLSNALKFTSPGEKVSVKLTTRENTGRIEVRDSGVGIEPALLPHIFDQFRQSDQSLDRSSGGLGLGLALVKTLVDLHGGSVVAESAGLDKGTTITVTLPLTPAPRSPRTSNRPASAPLRILVVEDADDVREMTRMVLEHAGHEVQVAMNGKEAIASAKSTVPDVVLCDLGLPDGVTGFDVARALRDDASTRSVLLVAVSGYGRPEDKARAKEAGFDEHLTKPVDLKELSALLSGRTRS